MMMSCTSGRRARRAQHGGDLAVTQPRLALETQHLADLAHGQPRLRHRRPPREPPRKGHGSVVVLLSLPGPACRGMLARHAVERRPDITWNHGPACCGICTCRRSTENWPAEHEKRRSGNRTATGLRPRHRSFPDLHRHDQFFRVSLTVKLRGRPKAPIKRAGAHCLPAPAARTHRPFTDPSNDC